MALKGQVAVRKGRPRQERDSRYKEPSLHLINGFGIARKYTHIFFFWWCVVYVYVCVHVCAHVYTDVTAHVCICMWEPEIDIHNCSTPFFWDRISLGLGLTDMARLASQQARKLPVSTPQHWDYKGTLLRIELWSYVCSVSIFLTKPSSKRTYTFFLKKEFEYAECIHEKKKSFLKIHFWVHCDGLDGACCRV